MSSSLGRVTEGVGGAFLMAGAILTSFSPYLRQWGATEAEVDSTMPGDEIVPHARRGYTQAITIEAPRHQVWLWVAQTGQDRGGFYSYEFLENLVGCDIHNVDRVMAECQHNKTSAGLKMDPKVPPMPLAAFEPERTLVFGGSMDPNTPVSWGFFLEDAGKDSTRLISRWRFAYKPNLGTRVAYGMLGPIACVMQRKMLLGIKKRAEVGKK